MDINYLLDRQQVSIMRAANAAGPEARFAHEGLAAGYGLKLRLLGFPVRWKAVAAGRSIGSPANDESSPTCPHSDALPGRAI